MQHPPQDDPHFPQWRVWKVSVSSHLSLSVRFTCNTSTPSPTNNSPLEIPITWSILHKETFSMETCVSAHHIHATHQVLILYLFQLRVQAVVFYAMIIQVLILMLITCRETSCLHYRKRFTDFNHSVWKNWPSNIPSEFHALCHTNLSSLCL